MAEFSLPFGDSNGSQSGINDSNNSQSGTGDLPRTTRSATTISSSSILPANVEMHDPPPPDPDDHVDNMDDLHDDSHDDSPPQDGIIDVARLNSMIYNMNDLVREERKSITLANRALQDILSAPGVSHELRLKGIAEARAISSAAKITLMGSLQTLSTFGANPVEMAGDLQRALVSSAPLSAPTVEAMPVASSQSSSSTSSPSLSIYSILLVNRLDSPAFIESDDLVALFRQITRGCKLQIVKIARLTDGVKISLWKKEMVPIALNKLNTATRTIDQVKQPLRDTVDFGSETRSEYAIRTDKIPSGLVSSWFTDGKLDFLSAARSLHQDNEGFFPSLSDIENIVTWRPKLSPDHRVFLIYVSADVYKSFTSTITDNTAIFIGLQTWRVFEEVSPTICFRCLHYGHKSAGCTLPQKCYRCAGPHHGKTCNSSVRACAVCLDLNDRLNQGDIVPDLPGWTIRSTAHSPFSDTCEARRFHKDVLRAALKPK